MRAGEDTESSLPSPPADGGSRLGYVLRVAPRMPFVWFMRAYRVVISPLYGDVCRYYPSCSKYALDAFEVKGAVAGMFMAAWRVLRCNPFTRGGVDHVKGSVLERRSAEIWGQDDPGNNGRMYKR